MPGFAASSCEWLEIRPSRKNAAVTAKQSIRTESVSFRGEGMRTIRDFFFRLLSVFRSGRAGADFAAGQAKESPHDAPPWALDSWWLDVKLGVRMLVKYPGLALVGGIGIAVAVAISAGGFSIMYGTILSSSLPLEEGDRIVSIEIWDAAASKPERRVLHDY